MSQTTAPTYDLLLKGGRVIDPASSADGPMDLAVAGRRIAAVQADIPASAAARVADVTGWLVLPGLIDMHAHCYGFEHAMFPDEMCFPYGVTTMLDVGGAGWRTYDDFEAAVLRRTRVRVFALMNIVGRGMVGNPYEQDIDDMDPRATAERIAAAGEACIGVKVAHFEGPGWEAVDRGVEAAGLSGTWVMVDQNPLPSRTMDRMLLEHLRPGDVLTHAYSFNKPIVDAGGNVKKHFWQARENGIVFDTGHGNGNFSFRMAVPAIEQGFLPDTVSTDLHRKSLLYSVPTMTEVMSKLIAAGMSLEDVVERSTVNPARHMGHAELGTLSVGAPADIAALEMAQGDFGLSDNSPSGYRVMKADRRLVCQITIRDGEVVWDRNGRTKEDWTKTPPPDTSMP